VTATAPPIAVAVSPARIVLAAGETQAIHVANRGTEPAAVRVTTAGYALALRGRVRIVEPGGAVVVRPARLVVPARGSVDVIVSGRAGGPGDHPSLVLFTTQRSASDIAVRLRVGVVVLVRGRGALVHRVLAERLVARARQLDLWLRNAGNVAEPLRIRIRVGGRWLHDSRLILPHSRAVATFSARVAARRALVEVDSGGRVLRRTLRIRR
jgi:hypothetical protein